MQQIIWRLIALNCQLQELEQAFRGSWRCFNPERYAHYLNQIDTNQQLDLLVRLLSAELEFAFQPPSGGVNAGVSRLGQPSSGPVLYGQPPVDEDSGEPSRDCISDPDIQGDTEDDHDQRVRPCVPLFLLRFPELSRRSELVIRLIILEYALRLRHDPRPPNPESYLPLCEQARDQLIRLLELTENTLPVGRVSNSPVGPIGRSDSTIKEALLSASIVLDPLPLNLGCFLLLRLLGRGGMGYVHAALDLRSTAQVAVKTMRRVDAWSIYRFIEEFRWLSQLSHPHLVKLYDAFCDGEMRYFSMELVEGKMIRDWFRMSAQRLESHWEKLSNVLGQLASAVDYLHVHQVIHCDLKCSNMMITANRRAVLLDLGLAIRAGQDNRLVGTLQYMAPEVIRGGSASFASDWYSFGVMIFEVLTDTFPPIEVEPSESAPDSTTYQLDLAQVLSLLDGCPDGLAQLCIDLLQSDPAQRPKGSEVVQRLSGNKQPWSADETRQLCWGRDQELQELNCAVRYDSRTSLVILRAEAGSGKTTLLNHWLRTLPELDNLLLSVQCYRQDHTPFRLLNAIVQELTVAVPRLAVASWEPALEKLADEICVLFPQIQQLSARDVKPRRSVAVHGHTAQLPPPDQAAAEDASLGSLVQWLLQLSHHRRLVICVDDAQWADLESLRTLKHLLDHSGRFQGTLVLIDESKTTRLHDVFSAAPRRGPLERSQNDVLETDPTAPLPSSTSADCVPCVITQIDLAPLDQPTCRAVLDRWSSNGPVPMSPVVAEDITHRCCGNPFLLREIFRAYVHHVATQGAAGEDWLPGDLPSSTSRRFSVLPHAAENILQYLAVAGLAMSFYQLQMVSRILPDELQRLLEWLASQGWISSSSNALDADIEIANENFRQAILQSIAPERIHRRHYRLARALSCETPPLWTRIGNHYWEAGHFREASACYMEAVRKAHAAGDWEEALQLFQRAEHPEAQRTDNEKLNVLRLKADCLAGAGYSQAAARLYDRLRR